MVDGYLRAMEHFWEQGWTDGLPGGAAHRGPRAGIPGACPPRPGRGRRRVPDPGPSHHRREARDQCGDGRLPAGVHAGPGCRLSGGHPSGVPPEPHREPRQPVAVADCQRAPGDGAQVQQRGLRLRARHAGERDRGARAEPCAGQLHGGAPRRDPARGDGARGAVGVLHRRKRGHVVGAAARRAGVRPTRQRRHRLSVRRLPERRSSGRPTSSRPNSGRRCWP